MPSESEILCDGCGRPASPEHIARRLQRLEGATRYRPIHIQTLLLSGISPAVQSDFLYSPDSPHTGEGAQIFSAAGIIQEGRSADSLHSEFQRRGLFLTHILECPLEAVVTRSDEKPEASHESGEDRSLLETRIPKILTRIRRSLKPRRVALISPALAQFVDSFSPASMACDVLLDNSSPFHLDEPDALARLREQLRVPVARQ
jgi:hypothetical protein